MKAKLSLTEALLALAGLVSAPHSKPVGMTPKRLIFIDLDPLVGNGHTRQAGNSQEFWAGQTSATWQGTFF